MTCNYDDRKSAMESGHASVFGRFQANWRGKKSHSTSSSSPDINKWAGNAVRKKDGSTLTVGFICWNQFKKCRWNGTRFCLCTSRKDLSKLLILESPSLTHLVSCPDTSAENICRSNHVRLFCFWKIWKCHHTACHFKLFFLKNKNVYLGLSFDGSGW